MKMGTQTFLAQLHHLRWSLNHMASLFLASSPSTYASYDVSVRQLAILLGASSTQTLTDLHLPFASRYRLLTTWFSTVIFLQRTFTPLVHAHAGRTKRINARHCVAGQNGSLYAKVVLSI